MQACLYSSVLQASDRLPVCPENPKIFFRAAARKLDLDCAKQSGLPGSLPQKLPGMLFCQFGVIIGYD
jgi:hypothetical protein